jgi:hypothetical protein
MSGDGLRDEEWIPPGSSAGDVPGNSSSRVEKAGFRRGSLADELVSTRSQKLLRHVPLLAAGVLVFFGVVFLGGLTGLLWHLRSFGWWMTLNPSVLGPTFDWVIWGVSFLLVVSAVAVVVARKGMRLDPVLALTSFIFPLLSLGTLAWSYIIGGTLLVGSGFLAAYALVSRSKPILGIERGPALRLVCGEVFAFLTVTAAGGVVCILLWPQDVFVSGSSVMGIWLDLFAVDLEVFYLARPVLLGMLFLLGAVAFVMLFMDPMQWVSKRVSKRPTRETPSEQGREPSGMPQAKLTGWSWLPYVVLAGSIALGATFTLYPYVIGATPRVLGSDMWFYARALNAMMASSNPFSMLEADRGFFILVLYAIAGLTHLEVVWILRSAPAFLSALLAVSVFALAKEGTGRPWVAAFAALLSVASAQTNLGMSAGILANWFALSLLNFMFALVIRAIRLHSRLAAVASIFVSLVLLPSFTYLWVAAVAVLTIALVATLVSFRLPTRQQWRRESTFFGAILAGTAVLPAALLFVLVVPLLGSRPAWFDPSTWLSMAWNYLAGRTSMEVLVLAPAAIEEAFDFAGNRIDLPLLTLLSLLGLSDLSSCDRSFRKLVSAMILMPLVLAAISPNIYSTWRGLYVLPLYLTGAVGTASLVRRINQEAPPARRATTITIAGLIAGYIFLTHLSYSLRALELLIIVGSR